MDITGLMDYMVLVIVGICLCIGYALKTIDVIPNKYIPLTMLVLGTFINVWINGWGFSPDILLGGMISGLASTGLHQAFYQLIYKDEIEVIEVEGLDDIFEEETNEGN